MINPLLLLQSFPALTPLLSLLHSQADRNAETGEAVVNVKLTSAALLLTLSIQDANATSGGNGGAGGSWNELLPSPQPSVVTLWSPEPQHRTSDPQTSTYLPQTSPKTR